MKIGFDNDKYLKIQSEHIKERIAQFDGKLYMELGGKLFAMTTMHHEFCQDSSPTVSSVCWPSCATASRLSS